MADPLFYAAACTRFSAIPDPGKFLNPLFLLAIVFSLRSDFDCFCRSPREHGTCDP